MSERQTPRSADADHCDNCGKQRPCYRLDLGNSAGVSLCRECWPKEMEWRKERNAEGVANPFDILPWPVDVMWRCPNWTGHHIGMLCDYCGNDERHILPIRRTRRGYR